MAILRILHFVLFYPSHKRLFFFSIDLLQISHTRHVCEYNFVIICLFLKASLHLTIRYFTGHFTDFSQYAFLLEPLVLVKVLQRKGTIQDMYKYIYTHKYIYIIIYIDDRYIPYRNKYRLIDSSIYIYTYVRKFIIGIWSHGYGEWKFPSANWGTKKASGVIQSNSEGLKNRGANSMNSSSNIKSQELRDQWYKDKTKSPRTKSSDA